MTAPDQSTYYRRGFGLKSEVEGTLAADYDGRLVDLLRERDYVLTAGDVTVRLAREFGFCYGVERAVEYAYQARRKFPERRILLVGEIIHNPHVNSKLRKMGVEILARGESGFDFSGVRPEDVVILPAFGVTIHDFETLRGLGAIVVDTTCGSVLNVWKRVESYARDGLTSLIHGKYYHEETRATASQVFKFPGAHYLVVRNMDEARLVMDYIEGLAGRPASQGSQPAEKGAFLERFARAASPGFDPDVHLARIGVANQTTMLARESLAIGEEVGKAMARARGDDYRAANFRTFDTICSATQDRQDAVEELLRQPLDVMLVVGGFNSSNTMSLAALSAERVPTYHVEDASGIDPETRTVRYRPVGLQHAELEKAGWLPAEGPVVVGITAGASTPNNKIGEAVARVFATRGIDPREIE
ncbi:MAG TPA: 4-hydroxy-3-methylbut-2-enyl diphosphate reductase [Gemmatimonadaceae bacterium]|nr:4-hydroxy-3-methylbut-2-enyl diphosphate reductase [Gemmatimonadaceae bacterium]